MKDAAKVKELVSQLQAMADEEGCSLEDMIEEAQGGSTDEEEAEGESPKLAMIVARMKAKNKPMGEEEA